MFAIAIVVGCSRGPAVTPDAATADAPAPATTCGDGTCQTGETLASCPADCFVCGDGICSGPETAASCAADCSICGDAMCTGAETAMTCAADCTVCGDHACTGDETATSCAADCAASLKVENSSSYTVYYLYVWPCTATNTHVNQLAGTLPANYFVTLSSAVGCFAFQAATSANAQMWTGQHTFVGGETYTWTLTN